MIACEQCQKPIIFFFFYWEEGVGRGEETKIMMIKYVFIFFAFMYNTIYDTTKIIINIIKHTNSNQSLTQNKIEKKKGKKYF